MRIFLFTIVVHALLGFLAGPSFCEQGNEKPTLKDKPKAVVAARVNGTEIMLDRVNEVAGRMQTKDGTGKERNDSFKKKEALDRLIFQELAYQKAKALGLSVDEKKISEAVERIRRDLGETEYLKYLNEQGMTEEGLRKQVERAFLGEMVVVREVADKIVIAEVELRTSYEKEKPSLTKQEKMSVVDVVFFLDMKDGRSLEKAEKVRRKIVEDKDKNPLNLTSDGTFSAVEIDNLRKDGHEELYEAAKKLKPGDLSGIITTDDSFHIIKLVRYVPEKVTPYEEVKGYLQKKMKAAEIKKRLREWEAGLRKEAKIEIAEALFGAGNGKTE